MYMNTKRLLQLHSVYFMIQEDTIFALEEYNIGFGSWINVTDLSREELLIWLGY